MIPSWQHSRGSEPPDLVEDVTPNGKRLDYVAIKGLFQPKLLYNSMCNFLNNNTDVSQQELIKHKIQTITNILPLFSNPTCTVHILLRLPCQKHEASEPPIRKTTIQTN